MFLVGYRCWETSELIKAGSLENEIDNLPTVALTLQDFITASEH